MVRGSSPIPPAAVNSGEYNQNQERGSTCYYQRLINFAQFIELLIPCRETKENKNQTGKKNLSFANAYARCDLGIFLFKIKKAVQ